jgi:hypothetical protein
MIVTGSNSEFKIAPVGNHLARLYRVIDLGTQMREWEGKTNMTRRVKFFWELHGEDEQGKPLSMDDGRPMIQSREYTWSLHEKAALRQHLEAWRGLAFSDAELKGFDIKKVLGQFCMLTIAHRASNGKNYADVKNVSSVPSIIRKAGLPAGINDTMIFDLTKFDPVMFESLSEWIKAIIVKSSEYRAMGQPTTVEQYVAASGGSVADIDDDLPF